MAVKTMDKPTGPTGVLQSGKTGPKPGGRKTMGGTSGIVSSPAKKMFGVRKMSRGRR